MKKTVITAFVLIFILLTFNLEAGAAPPGICVQIQAHPVQGFSGSRE
jgi:hypothetical protein